MKVVYNKAMLQLTVTLSSAVFGLIVGSFLNVLALRLNTGQSLGGRSHCATCGEELRWYDLIPLLSYLTLKGKCRSCKAAISLQYPLVEAGTAILFAATAAAFVGEYTVTAFLFEVGLVWVIWSILIVILVYDIYHKIIPDSLVYTFIFLALSRGIWKWIEGSFDPYDLYAGIVFFAFFATLWVVSRGRWIGFGDAKLVTGIGFFLGFVEGVSAIVIAFWSGALLSLFLIGYAAILGSEVGNSPLRSRSERLTMKSEIPFAPFLIFGSVVAYFFALDVVGVGIFFT